MNRIRPDAEAQSAPVLAGLPLLEGHLLGFYTISLGTEILEHFQYY